MVSGLLIFKHIRVQNCALWFLKLNSVNLKTMEVSNKWKFNGFRCSNI